MYRPFVTCDDPKGIVECGTVRKSKHVVQKMEEEEHNRKMARHKSKGFVEEARVSMGKRKGDKEHHHFIVNNSSNNNPSSFQLLEVSKGAQKLNKVIDSWCKEGSKEDNGFKHGSKEKMATDLLKGALDLKESLVMLGKLQEASKYMAKLKKKQQQKKEEEVPEVSMLRRVSSCREGGNGSGSGDCQKPRHSYDGGSSSGDYIDELRNAITDSFERQNLLSGDERAWLDRRRRGVDSMDQAQCSSKAIVVHPTESSRVIKKERSSNVIARLMGLEEMHPPESPPRIPQMRADIQMPKLRKQQQQQEDALRVKAAAAAVHEAQQQQFMRQRSLKELLDKMEFRGLLLKGSSVKKEEELKAHSESNHHQLSLSDIGSTPPIVLIKPFHVPESEEGQVVSSNLHLKKVRPKENLSGRSQRIDQEEVKRIVNGKNRMMEERKLVAEGGGRKSISRDNGGLKEQKEAGPRAKEGNNGKIRAGGPVRQEEKKEIVDKKVDKILKMVATIEEAPVEKETVKVRHGTRSHDKGKVPTTRKMRSSESGGIGSRSQSSQQPTATTLNNAKGKKKEKKKLVDEVTDVILDKTDLQEQKEDYNEVDPVGEIRPVEEESSSIVATAEQICRAEEVTTPLEVEHCTESLIPQRNAPPETSECRENVQSADLKARIQFKSFLLSSREFLTRVEELFPLTAPSPNTLSPTSTAFDSLDEKLSLDYANELIRCRSDPDSHARRRHSLPLPSSCPGLGALRVHFSLDQLVEEVYNGVETLKEYSNNKLVWGSSRQATDSVKAILERDVKSVGVVSGVWELGWRNGFSMEEAERAVIDLETTILDQLIDEVFTT